VTDPFQFVDKSRTDDDLDYHAPAEAVDSWLELARAVETELTRMGFAASVLRESAFHPYPSGAHIRVHESYPFGVELSWRAPVTETESYRGKLRAQDAGSPLLRYVLDARKVIVEALLDVLAKAGFRTQIDHEGSTSYLHRVLEAPPSPLE
jgi:hypothetical protein